MDEKTASYAVEAQGRQYADDQIVKMEVSGQLRDWMPYFDKSQPVWFWVIMNVKSDLAGWGMKRELEREVRQELKRRSLSSLNLRGNMLNLREKHIPRIKEIYRTVLEEYITWV